MRRDCTTLHLIRKRIELLRPTRSFDVLQLHCMALVEFSADERRLGYFYYNIGNNKDYHFHNKFEFEAPYQPLVAHIFLVSGAGLADDEPVAAEAVNDRPVGTTVAKNEK